MIEAYINDERLELVPGQSIVLKKSASRIGQFNRRQGLFTEDFEVPLSVRNTRLIGYNDRLSSASRLPYKKQGARLVQRGQELSRGFFQLTRVNLNSRTATLCFYGDNTNWFDLLGPDSLRDLDLKDLNHDWTEANITGSFANTDGYIYPVVDPGSWVDRFSILAHDTFVYEWYPAVFQHTLISRILQRIGYTMTGDFTRHPYYTKPLVPVVRMINKDAAFNSSYATGEASQAVFLINPPSGTNEEFTTGNLIATNDTTVFNLAADTYTAIASTTAVLRFRADIDLTELSITNDPGATSGAEVQIMLNGTAIFTHTLDEITTTPTSQSLVATPLTYTLDQTIVQAVTPGDTLSLRIRLYYDDIDGGASTEIRCDIRNYRIDQIGGDVDSNLIPGDTIDIAYQLPDISQRDFLRDFFVRHGLMVTSDNSKREVHIEPLEWLIKETDAALDWTAKLDNGKVTEFDYTELVQNYGRANSFAYTPDDSDVYLADYNFRTNMRFGAGSIAIDNDFIDASAEFYTSPFSPTIHPGSFPNSSGATCFIPYIPRFSYDSSERQEVTPRILMLAENVFTTAFKLQALSLEGNILNQAPYAYFSRGFLVYSGDRFTAPQSYQTGLAWDVPEFAVPGDSSLLAQWYPALTRILNNPRYIQVVVKLWEHEYRELDFTRLVFADTERLQGYFLVDEIEQYDGNFAVINLIQVV